MEIKFFNTLSNKKEIFVPLKANEVTIYNCGVTVYDRCHLGHARGAINFDVLRNLLKSLGYKVTYVKNYTDIDDKIIDRANSLKTTTVKLADEMIKSHDADMESLNISPPDVAPKATEHMAEIIDMIAQLIKKDYAYQTEEGVFFKVRKFNEYGKLSGKNIDDLLSGIRVEINKIKEDALDFALWKTAKEGEPFWESPWGDGRPGWHIECSAMSQKYLGKTFDIHAGGSDLIFPHHENELAQSEACHSKPFVKYWLHNGMIIIDKQKMSKSLGNFALISELTQKYTPEVIRFFILSTQYRHTLNFSADGIVSAADGIDRIYRALESYENLFRGEEAAATGEESEAVKSYRSRFFQNMSDDLNSPQAIGVLFEITRELNSINGDNNLALHLKNLLLELGDILGILKIKPVEWFQSPRIKTDSTKIDDKEIEQLISERKIARKGKDFKKADQIRDKLLKNGVIIEDKDGRTNWKRK